MFFPLPVVHHHEQLVFFLTIFINNISLITYRKKKTYIIHNHFNYNQATKLTNESNPTMPFIVNHDSNFEDVIQKVQSINLTQISYTSYQSMIAQV